MLLMVFMAVTSCGSAELIAVSSLLTYDVYHTYLNPTASGEQVRPTQTNLSCLCIKRGVVQLIHTLTRTRTYFSKKKILRVSRRCVVLFGLAMGGLAVLLEAVGLQLGCVRTGRMHVDGYTHTHT